MNLIDDLLPEPLPRIFIPFAGEDATLLKRLGVHLGMDPVAAVVELVRRTVPPENGKGFSSRCDHCGLPYTAFHRPKPSVKHYCSRPECKREAAAERARRYRDRKAKR